MNVTVETKGACRRLVKVEFSAEEIQAEYDEWLQVYQRQGKVKGFRPGKAPPELVQRIYNKEILENMRDPLVAKGYQQAVKEHHLANSVAEMDLQLSELKAGQPFSFSVVVDLEPEFELPEYKGIEIDAKKVEIADEAVTEFIENYRMQTGKFEELTEERPVQMNDMAAVDYTATVDGQPLAEFSEKAKELATATDYWVMVNEEYSFLPGFGPQLAGMKVGDFKAVEVVFDEARSPIEDLKGKTVVFQTTVKKIKARIPRAMDEEFFKSMGVADEEGLRKAFRDMLQHEAEMEEQKRRRNDLLDVLFKRVEMELPESEVASETNQVVYEIVDSNARRGVPEQQIREKLEEITASAGATAQSRLKMRYILQRIARAENIAAADAEITRRMEQYAYYAGAKTIAEWLKRTRRKEKAVRDDLRIDLTNSKVVDFLMAEAKLTGEGAVEAPEEKK